MGRSLQTLGALAKPSLFLTLPVLQKMQRLAERLPDNPEKMDRALGIVEAEFQGISPKT